jgi:hypothetical protein
MSVGNNHRLPRWRTPFAALLRVFLNALSKIQPSLGQQVKANPDRRILIDVWILRKACYVVHEITAVKLGPHSYAGRRILP